MTTLQLLANAGLALAVNALLAVLTHLLLNGGVDGSDSPLPRWLRIAMLVPPIGAAAFLFFIGYMLSAVAYWVIRDSIK